MPGSTTTPRELGADEQMPFSVLRARFNVYRGCLALRRGEPDRAFALLNDGLSALAGREYDLSYSFKWQLGLIERDVLPQCEPAIVRCDAAAAGRLDARQPRRDGMVYL